MELSFSPAKTDIVIINSLTVNQSVVRRKKIQ